MKRLVLAAAALCCSLAAGAQSFSLNSEKGIYAKGERVVVTLEGVSASATLNFHLNSLPEPFASIKVEPSDGVQTVLDTTYNECLSIRLALVPEGGKNPLCEQGFIVAPEECTTGYTAPKDMLRWWKKQIKAMRAEPSYVRVVPVPSPREYLSMFEVEIGGPDGIPVSGYMAYPTNADPASLPAIVYCHAAGDNHWTSATRELTARYAGRGDGCLVLDFNAHGMDNEREDEDYYTPLYRTTLKGYAERKPVSRDTYYFKNMVLRAQKAVDFICSNRLWDGNHLIVTGTSQGGYQSAFLAALDPRVSAACVEVPAGLDQGGPLQGRRGAWPQQVERYGREVCDPVLPYFDPALILKYSKAEFWCEIGLFDQACPPRCVFAAMNQLTTPVQIITSQRTHWRNKATPEWNRMVDMSRDVFFERKLKD
ncbi:MAG: acetylxylan esterase [Bacteroidales bacterium]|nr:acetylxylan esterase [Candidatus Cryptobacteroides aphodequi]